MRSLVYNKLGTEGGMALTEALKSNSTLKELRSTALPWNPRADAFSPHSVHPRCPRPCSPFLLPCVQAQ